MRPRRPSQPSPNDSSSAASDLGKSLNCIPDLGKSASTARPDLSMSEHCSPPCDRSRAPSPSPPAGQPQLLRHRLRSKLPAWRAAGAPPSVLRWIEEGVSCEWARGGPPPPYDLGVSLRDMTPAQEEFMAKELPRCLASGAWESAPPDERTHICRVHLVPKKTPPGEKQKWRCVIDLRPTNAWCVGRSCKYETLRSLQRLARRGDWIFSWDIQDGYHAVGVRRDHRRYMTFALPPASDSPDGQPRYFRCAALPFGWLMSPYVFTKVMRVMVRMLRSPTAPSLARLRRSAASGRALVLRLSRRGGASTARGLRILPYVDDFLAVCSTRRDALAARDRCQAVMDHLGIVRHPDKGEWEPTQRLEHLGLDVDTSAGLFRVPPRKLTELMRQARDVIGLATREARLVPARLLAGFIGYAQSVSLACPPARFYLRSLHDALATRTSWDGRVRLGKQALRDLAWWKRLDRADVARAIWQEPEQATVHTDASKLAWGAVLNSTVPAHGFWRPRDRSRHITYLELLAVHRALQTFLARLQGRSTLLWCDNQSVVHILTNRTTRSPEMMALLRRVWWLLDSAGIDLRVRWISTHENDYADALSRGSPHDELMIDNSCWTRLQRRFGPHDVDRYASVMNTRCPRFNSEMPNPASEGAPALAQDWTGVNNYAFPPMAELPALAQLLSSQPSVRATVVAPHWPAQAWYQQLFEASTYVELWPALSVCTPPSGLHGSAQHVLLGATLAFFRVEGRLDTHLHRGAALA